MVLKIGTIGIGVILILLLNFFMPSLDQIGLIGIGFLVGYIEGNGAMSGLINSVIVGIIGNLVKTIIFVFMSSYATIHLFIMEQLTTITLMAALEALVPFYILMGIAGAIGGALNNRAGGHWRYE
jgi:hypothetical protein